VVVSDRADAAGIPDAVVTTAAGYIEGQRPVEPNTTVVNLCRTLGYGSDGYYVSLLADARGHDVLPRLETNAGITDPYARFRALQEAGVATLDVADLSADAAGREAAGPDGAASVIACFGSTTDTRFRSLAGAVYGVWPAPLLRIQALRVDGQWKVADLAHAAPDELDAEQRQLLREALTGNARALRRGTAGRDRDAVRASIAVLLDDTDPFSASTLRTVERFEAVAAKLNVHVARITASDLRRLPEYDALWIRSLTDVRLPSFQFALRAEALDMPVIDDAQSIIRCSNKVFLEELLRREGLPLPRGRIVTAHTPWSQLEELGLPFVIKAPDGSFSVGVHKISSRQDFEDRARELLQNSPLLIAQEWLPTDFDWRITILGGRLLFAARYYMAHGHWQIRAEDAGVERYGKVVAVRRADAPAAVVNIALQAAALIGAGMYGVDLKETAGGPVVIEVNDNPNLDTGYEDAADGDVIYRDIVTYFVDRIEEATDPPATAPAPRPAPARRGRPALIASRRPRSKPAQAAAAPAARYGAFEVAGLELEYPTVDDELNVVALVEPAFRAIAGRGTSDIELDGVGFSNEIADHVFEVKTLEPVRTLQVAEEAIVAGINRFADVLRREWNARLLPTGMHPWFDPDARPPVDAVRAAHLHHVRPHLRHPDPRLDERARDAPEPAVRRRARDHGNAHGKRAAAAVPAGTRRKFTGARWAAAAPHRRAAGVDPGAPVPRSRDVRPAGAGVRRNIRRVPPHHPAADVRCAGPAPELGADTPRVPEQPRRRAALRPARAGSAGAGYAGVRPHGCGNSGVHPRRAERADGGRAGESHDAAGP
jgi:glutathione synthase/RimK-type ligase-like ATP-grasp enzyme